MLGLHLAVVIKVGLVAYEGEGEFFPDGVLVDAGEPVLDPKEGLPASYVVN